MPANWQRGVLRMMRVANHPVTVVSVTDLTSWYRRIVFHAPEFVQRLEVFPTLWLRLWVPNSERGDGYVSQRGYTLVDVRPDEGTFALDFVLHDTKGPAGDWARHALPGEALEVAVTPAKPRLPDATTTVVLAGDATAVPAINSWLEHLPADVRAHTLIEDPHDDCHDLPIVEHERNELRWLTPTDRRGDALAAAVADTVQPGNGVYAWAAGEKTLVKTLRPILRERLALDRQRHHTQFYWIDGRSAG